MGINKDARDRPFLEVQRFSRLTLSFENEDYLVSFVRCV